MKEGRKEGTAKRPLLLAWFCIPCVNVNGFVEWAVEQEENENKLMSAIKRKKKIDNG